MIWGIAFTLLLWFANPEVTNDEKLFARVYPEREPVPEDWLERCAYEENQWWLDRKLNYNNNDMVDQLLREEYIEDPKVEQVMREVDRGDFIHKKWYNLTDKYDVAERSIEYGAAIWDPELHAYSLGEYKNHFKINGKVLNIGSGSGIMLPMFLKMMNNTGTVVGVEHVKEIYQNSKKALEKNYKKYLENGQIKLVLGDGRKGYNSSERYDVLHVGWVTSFPPREIINQLAVGGKMMIAIGPHIGKQRMRVIVRNSPKQIFSKHTLKFMTQPLWSLEYHIQKMMSHPNRTQDFDLWNTTEVVRTDY